MSDALAERRALVARAKEAGISGAMKMKSADIEAALAAIRMGEPVMSETVHVDPEPTIQLPTGENADPEAPYGRRADGTPKAKPGRKSNGAPRTPAAPRPTSGRRTPARTKASTAIDYRPGIAGLLQIPAFVLVSAGRFNPALELDGIAIAAHTPALAEAVHQLATEEPRVAAVLEKVLQVGPYGAILGALVPLAAQLATNHKKLPPGTMGSVEPETLRASFVGTPEG